MIQRTKDILNMAKHSEPPLSLAEIGKIFGISRERVRQIYTKNTGQGYRRFVNRVASDKKKEYIDG